MMTWRRQFLGWDQPALRKLSDFLVATFAPEEDWNLADTLVVLPTHHALRELLSDLTERADDANALLIPPTTATPGELVRYLLPLSHRLVHPIEARFAWTQVLRSASSIERETIAKRWPDDEDIAGWHRFADVVIELRELLAGHTLTLRDIVLKATTPKERARLETLRDIEERYLKLLAENEGIDPHLFLARAIKEKRPKRAGRILLAGTVDLLPVQEDLINIAAANGSEVVALIFAPSELQEGFGARGEIREEFWSKRPIAFNDKDVKVARGPREQAEATLVEVIRGAECHEPTDFTIVLCDREVLPRLVDAAGRLSWEVDVWEETRSSGTMRLLGALARYVARESSDDLAVLVRHPDLHDWLRDPEESAGAFATRLIGAIDAARALLLSSKLRLADLDEALAKSCLPLAKTLARWPIAASPLSKWVAFFAEILSEIYAHATSEAKRAEIAQIGRALRAAAERNDELLGLLEASQALVIVQTLLAPLRMDSASPIALRAVGWLDAPFDLRPCLIVTGMNEGKLSGRGGGSPFLSEELATKLKLEGGGARSARDRYYLSLLAASGRHLSLVFGQKSADGDPILPSSLLFSASTTERARRVRRYFAEQGTKYQYECAAEPLVPLVVPTFSKTAGLDELNVTAFRDYLACPYRFYLKHVLKLRAVEDAPREMGALAFGSLLHRLLQDFGISPVRHSQNAGEIFAFLESTLDQTPEVRRGDLMPAVAIQI